MNTKITLGKQKKFTKDEIIKQDESLKSWIQTAQEKQDFYCATLGTRTWEIYKNNERQFLKLKLGFAIFGPPSNIDGDGDINNISFKEPIQSKIIDDIVDLIEKVSESEDIYLAFIYIISKVKGEYAEFPIIRVLKENGGYITNTSFFIDILGRFYKNWNEFLEDNVFPKGVYCFPKNGFYSRDKDLNVQLEFGYSPACRTIKKFAKGMGTLSDAAMIGSTTIGLAALALPIATPVLVGSAVAGVTSGIWMTASNSTGLMDRKKHGQSIGLSDQDARVQWFSLVSGILGAAGAGAIHYSQLITRSGRVLSKVPSLIVSTLEIGCGVSSGSIYIINQILKAIDNKDLTSLDSAQFALSVLFFFHTRIDVKSVTKILLNLQKDVMTDLRKQMNSDQKSVIEYILNKGQTNNQNRGERGDIVKSLNVIDSFGNLEDIFRIDDDSFKVKSDLFVTSCDDDDWIIVDKS